MPGEPWDDLQEQMEARGLGGSVDTAREHWGTWSSKLETVFLVAVPSEANRNPARILPGREDVYIIPRADCTIWKYATGAMPPWLVWVALSQRN